MLKKAPTFFEEKNKKIEKSLFKIYEEILDFIFPPVCGICGKLNKNWLCENCKKTVNKLEKFYKINITSKRKFLIKNDKKICRLLKVKKEIFKNYSIKKLNKNFSKDIQLNKIFFDELIYIFRYTGLIRKLILKYKFNDCAYLYKFFSRIIFNKENCCRKLKTYDIIIPVPMYEKKKKQRGYNQTELIAKEVALTLNIGIDKECIFKVKNTKTQSTLSIYDRKKNIKNAFLVNNIESIKDKNIIIFDDIYTTGETVNELSKILRKAGARKILVFVLAKD